MVLGYLEVVSYYLNLSETRLYFLCCGLVDTCSAYAWEWWLFCFCTGNGFN